MTSRPFRYLVLTATLGLAVSFSASAATVSWWRFEAGEDDDPSANGLENPNEVGSEPALISSDATIGTNAPDLFDTVVPGPNVPNTGSIRSSTNGSGSDGIFGTAAYSSTLDIDSITVEFWMRTTESDAGFVARTTDFNDAGEQGTLNDGFRIVDPNNARVNFWTSDSSGNNTTQHTLSSGTSVNDGDWHYIAFTYDEATGVANLYVDDVTSPAATLDTGTDRPLWWGGAAAQPEVIIGYRMDGNPNNNTGTLDEIRFTDNALPPDDLLIVPETSQIVSVIALVALALVAPRLRRT
ncbi:MAG: LamG domain-containing protein [Verrucomicrobiota bacterium]